MNRDTSFRKWLGIAALTTLIVITALLLVSDSNAQAPKSQPSPPQAAASAPITAPPAPASGGGPQLTAADETEGKTLYNRAVVSQAAADRDRAAWQAWGERKAAERGFPKGTGFTVQLSKCDPDPKGGVHCVQAVSVVLPQAGQPAPGGKDKP